MYLTIHEKDLEKVQLKSGMVIQLVTENKEKVDPTKHPSVSNMLIVQAGSRFVAIETLWSGEEVVVDESTGNNYCVIDFEKYPHTMGINPIFGEHVCAIFNDIIHPDENHSYKVVHDEDGMLVSRF